MLDRARLCVSDVLTNFERVSDHCSNVAGCIIEISEDKALNMHQYLGNVKKNGAQFEPDPTITGRSMHSRLPNKLSGEAEILSRRGRKSG